MTSPVLQGVKQPLSGCLFFEAMAGYRKPDIREDIHIPRRRRVSIPSTRSNDGGANEDTAVDEKKPLSGHSDTAISVIQRESEVQSKVLELPDHTIHESPETFLQKLVKVVCDGLELETKKARSMEGFFAKVTDAQVEAYTTTVVTVVRNNDLTGLRKLQAKGQMLNCFNRFGESLLHMACRRGFEDIVDFLLEQPEIDVRICDDNGRTVLHDACWHPSPQLKICQRILEREPTLFFILDNRGCSPFQYARPEHWAIWRKFLLDNRECLAALKHPDTLDRLAKTP
jgi:Ankyrin repeats (3 copies)